MTDFDPGLAQTLFESYPGLVFVLDTELRYVRFNSRHTEALRDLTGAAPVVGEPVLAAIADENRGTISRATLDRALAGETFTQDTTFNLGRTEPRSYRVTFLPVRGNSGAVEALLVTALDISAEMRLKEALDAGETGYWTFESDPRQFYFSEGFYTMLGYGHGGFPMTFAGWGAQVHAGDVKSTLSQLRNLVRTESSSFQVEYRMRTSKGGWRWIQSRGRVVARDRTGRPLRIAGTNIDITRRKVTEQALAESEARWTSLVDEAPVGISLVGRGGQVLFENGYESGRKGSGALGMNWLDFLAPGLHRDVSQVLDLAFLEGKPSVFPTYRQLADGSTVHFENHASPVREEGSVKAVLVLSIDVTAQHRAEVRRAKAARRMEILLALHDNPNPVHRNLFETAIDAAVELTDSQAGFLDLYSEDTRLFSRHFWSKDPRDGCQTEKPQADYPLESAGYWAEAVRQRRPIMVNDFSGPSPFHRGLPAGHIPLDRFLSVPVFEKEKIVAVVGVANKVLPYDEEDTDELRILADSLWQLQSRNTAEEALNRLYQAVEHSPVGIVITDPEGRVEYANPRFSTMTGFSLGEVLGTVPRFLTTEQVPKEVLETLWSAVRSGREWQGEIDELTKTGKPLTVLVSISPVLDPQKGTTHVIAVKEDITERKEAQELLARAQKMEMVGQLAAGVAHDFNNLLTSVLGYNEMLLRKIEPTNPLRVYTEGIERSGRRAADLVAGLLAIGRQQRLSTVRADLGELLGAEVPLLASLVKGELRFLTELSPDPLWVEVDPGQLGQVVVNLVSNARDAVGGPGTIVLSSGKGKGPGQGDWAWFHVRDDGPGIPKELQAKIFEPFFTTKPIGKGTGLGLSIVQGIVQQHRGQVTVESTPGQGTKITVWLPLLAAGP